MITTKILASYLPYELKCEVTDLGEKKIGTMYAVYADGTACFKDIIEAEQGFEDIKPILKPLDGMSRYLVDGASQILIDGYLEMHYDIYDLISQGKAIAYEQK